MKVVVDIPETPTNDKQRWALTNGTPYEVRPHGEWVFKHNSSDIWCSNCDENFEEIPQKFLFCPNCGADMREGGEP